MKLPRNFYQPLAIGAPEPRREPPLRLERMIHFVPPHVEKLRAKVPELVGQVDVLLGNLEDAIPADAKEAARGEVRDAIAAAIARPAGVTPTPSFRPPTPPHLPVTRWATARST